MVDKDPFRLRYLGDPALREVARKYEFQADNGPAFLLIHRMLRLVEEYTAAGLAATQVGIPLRIAVIRVEGKLMVVINPEVLELSGETIYDDEGCLSIPEFTAQVPRKETIKFHFFNPEGQGAIATFHGMEARIAQHEFDHLDGKLIIDYVSRQQRRHAERIVASVLNIHRTTAG